jgi:hypothetical protein
MPLSHRQNSSPDELPVPLHTPCNAICAAGWEVRGQCRDHRRFARRLVDVSADGRGRPSESTEDYGDCRVVHGAGGGHGGVLEEHSNFHAGLSRARSYQYIPLSHPRTHTRRHRIASRIGRSQTAFMLRSFRHTHTHTQARAHTHKHTRTHTHTHTHMHTHTHTHARSLPVRARSRPTFFRL